MFIKCMDWGLLQLNHRNWALNETLQHIIESFHHQNQQNNQRNHHCTASTIKKNNNINFNIIKTRTRMQSILAKCSNLRELRLKQHDRGAIKNIKNIRHCPMNRGVGLKNTWSRCLDWNWPRSYMITVPIVASLKIMWSTIQRQQVAHTFASTTHFALPQQRYKNPVVSRIY